MDCVIPGPSVRPFCAALGCLSRVGKELYVEFDPIDGLTLRALNDSKSVFSEFHYQPSFFQRCSMVLTGRKRKSQSRLHSQTSTATTASKDEDRYAVRVAMKSLGPVVRPRKDVLSLQVVTVGDLLSFEFQLQRPPTVVRVSHRVGVAIASGVSAVTQMDGSSELTVHPNLLLTMLEPLRRAAEIALVINEKQKLVSSVTFTHDDISQEAGSNLAKPAALKTETSIGFDELIEVEYVVSHPNIRDEDIPEDLHEQTVLVFTLKEFKALLQFCSQAYIDQELQLSISFLWGGKPMVLRVDAESFSAQLVTATLDHKLLGAIKTSSVAMQ